MFRPLASSHRRPQRRGTSILLIALIMLTLFSAVGTAYVFFAIREARQAQARKEEQTTATGLAPPNPTDTFNRAMSALIYDTTDDGADLFNGFRGWSLARAMYGRDYSVHNPSAGTIGGAYNAANTWALTTPWAGPGMFQETTPSTGLPRTQEINFTPGFIGPNAPVLLDPEYSGSRTFNNGVPAQFVNDFGSRNYIGKNAPYTYPDLNNFHLAALDPATGQVMLPSFHRPTLFGSLDPSNPNWTNQTGWLKTLRPRPLEHPLFPRVPPNADGSYTGDVQNWPGGYTSTNGTTFSARNDSLWMNLGLSPIQFGNKKVVPLVAPLIIPIDGLFNASAHGNTFNAGSHFSYPGYGPWEVNLGYLLGGDAATVVTARGALQQRNGANTRAYASYTPGQPLPDYAPVAWAGNAVTFTYPTGNSITGLPAFNGFQSNNQAIAHPALFNPTEWPGTTGLAGRIFPVSDLKRLHRFGFTPNWYDQAELMSPNNNFTPNSLQVSAAFRSAFFVAPQQSTPANYNYRLDPNHLNRALITPRGFTLDRPKLVPNFATRDGTNALSYNAPGSPTYNAALASYKPGPVSVAAYPAPGVVGTVTDFAAANRWANIQAALGSVNLNRPLADYRSNTANTLATDVGNAAQATADRQQLASDIFARLVVATGAAGFVDTNPATGAVRITLPIPGTFVLTPPNGGTPVTYTQQQYDALRYLAQLAVNIVDYIDNDDISTPFIWNPANAPTDIVYGFEKPRLVINEAYGEIVNDPADPVDGPIVGGVQQPPAKPAQVRFWLELLNPTQTLTTAPSPGPLGDGSVKLSSYRILIRRETRTIGAVAGTADTGLFGSNQATALYSNPANTTGNFTSPADATVSLSTLNTTVSPNLPLPAAAVGTNPYNPSAAAPPPANLATAGFVLIGPPNVAPGKAGSEEFAPNGGVWANVLTPGAMNTATNSTATGYQFDLPASNADLSNQEFKRHIVLLQRLANPYLPFNAATNPYITVDMMDYVPAFDAVHRGKTDLTNRGARSAMNANGYDPINDPTTTNNRFSIGKVQPYAGHSVTTAVPSSTVGTYNQYSFGNANPALSSMVLPQNPSAGVAANTPMNTFGRHNGINAGQPGASTYIPPAGGATFATLKDASSGKPETLMTPYDWLVHMDRPLVNQIELFQVRDTPPHRVTDQFILASAAATPNGSTPGVTYDAGLARWRFVDDGLARALEYLTVKPYTAGVPHGGRLAGQINLNAVQDPRVIQGLFDPQGGNAFDSTYVTNTVWSNPTSTTWMSSRTPMQQFYRPNGTLDTMRPVPSASVYDTNGSDIPFLPFGAPAVAPGGSFAYSNVQNGTDLTILRRPNPNAYPYLYATKANSSVMPVTNSLPDGPGYLQAEPVRKILNNSTTVSHTYLVFLTIGYFEVDPSGPITIGGMSTPKLGPEAFISVPGDLRQKFVAVVDMSNMALDATTNSPASVQPFFTSLRATASPSAPGSATATLNIAYSRYDGTNNALYVAADGQEIAITLTKPNNQLVIGYGAEQQIVTVTGFGATPGQVSVTTYNGQPFRTAWAGTCVSNVRPGYPGVQSAFDYTLPQYQPVVPYVERLR